MLDDQPRVSQEPPDAPARTLAQIKAAVKRDLEWLLNSRQIVADLPAALGQARQSLLTYGLPDFTAVTLSKTDDQVALRRSIEEAVRLFEPRLRGVTVTLEPVRDLERALRFRIDAMLDVDPDPEPVTFDSVLQLNNKAFKVEGD
jgi:type VI secretion system protein ImpF